MLLKKVNRFLGKDNLVFPIILISIILKTILLLVLGSKTLLDGQYYIAVAEEIYNSGFLFPSSEISDAPGTPYFYALFYPLTYWIGNSGFAIGNIIISSFTIVVIFHISKEIFDDKKIANLTALIVLVYPFFNFYTLLLLTETIYIFFLYLSFLYAIRFIKGFLLKDLILFSLFFAIDTMIRFANLSMYIFFIVLFILILQYKRQSSSFIIKSVVVSLFTFSLAMTPWWVRNYNIHGEFVATSVGESAKVFYTGNNPMNNSGGGIGGVDVDLNKFAHIKDPLKKEEAMWHEAISWIKNNPYDWIVLEFKKLWRLYSPVFFAPQYNKWYYNLLSILSYGVVFLLFLYGLFKFKDKIRLYSPMLLYLILLTGVHLVFVASIRYRLPLEPFMIIMASPIMSLIVEKYAKNN